MKIKALVEQATIGRNIIGLVKDVDNLKRLGTNDVNLANTDTLVYVDLVFTDDTSRRVFCSKAVSAGLRSKEIKRSDLLNFPIVPFEHAEDDIRYYIQLPVGISNMTYVDVAELTPTIYRRKVTAFAWDDLITLGK